MTEPTSDSWDFEPADNEIDPEPGDDETDPEPSLADLVESDDADADADSGLAVSELLDRVEKRRERDLDNLVDDADDGLGPEEILAKRDDRDDVAAIADRVREWQDEKRERTQELLDDATADDGDLDELLERIKRDRVGPAEILDRGNGGDVDD